MANFSQSIKKVIQTDTYVSQRELMDESEVNKLEQAIEVHGYRGQSKMKHNGVVNIKPDDSQLWKSLRKYQNIEHKTINKIIKDNGLTFYVDVKVVAHCITGNRSIGSLYKNNDDELVIILLGFANYNYQLF